MWNVKAKVISVTTGAIGTISDHSDTIPEQHTWKARNQRTTKNSRIEHCTHTAESTNFKIQNIFHARNNVTRSSNCKYRTASATLYTLEKGLLQVYNCKYPA
jgi:hypothetical protein